VTDVIRYASSPSSESRLLSRMLQGLSRCIAFERMCSTIYPLLSRSCCRSGRYSKHAPIIHSERLPLFRSRTEAMLSPEMKLKQRWQQRKIAQRWRTVYPYIQPGRSIRDRSNLHVSAAEIGTWLFSISIYFSLHFTPSETERNLISTLPLRIQMPRRFSTPWCCLSNTYSARYRSIYLSSLCLSLE
jgi:hypothetical protein